VCNRASQFILRTAPVAEPGQRPSVDHEVFTDEEAGLGIDRLDVGSAPRRRGPSSYVNCPKEMTFSPRDQLPTIQQANGPRKSRSNNGMKFSATSWLKRIPPNARRLSLDRWTVGSLDRWLVGPLARWIVQEILLQPFLVPDWRSSLHEHTLVSSDHNGVAPLRAVAARGAGTARHGSPGAADRRPRRQGWWRSVQGAASRQCPDCERRLLPRLRW